MFLSNKLVVYSYQEVIFSKNDKQILELMRNKIRDVAINNENLIEIFRINTNQFTW